MSNADPGFGRPAIVASLVLHVVAFVIVVGVPRLLASSSGMGPVYVVDLVSPPGPSGPEPAAPKAAAAPAASPKATPPPKAPPKAATPKKPVEKSIVLPDKNAKKTPDKKAVEKKTPEKPKEPVKSTAPEAEETAGAAEESAAPAKPEAKAAPESAAAKPGAGSGPPSATGTAAGSATAPGAGGTGAGPGGGGDEYGFYLSLLKKRIEKAWNRPVYTGAETKSATVSLTLSRAGLVLRLKMSTPSGYEPLDRSLLRAVRDAEPFPPFPVALTLDTLAVEIVFNLEPEGAGTGGAGD